MKNDLKILLVEDDEDDYFLTRELLKEAKPTYAVDWVSEYDKALPVIDARLHDVYLIDYRLGSKSGLDLLNYITSKNIPVPVIILTGQGDPKTDLKAMESGASDYLVKGTFDANSLERAIRYATEQAQLVAMLRENEKKYRNLFEKSPDIIFVMDREGNVVDVNTAGRDILGYEEHEILDFGKRHFFSSEEDFSHLSNSLKNGKEIFNREVSFVAKNGNKIPCVLNTTALDREKGIFMGICHDISERKKIEENQRSADKFIASGRIARMLAHEVRNPITNINLAVEQLQDNNLNDEEQATFLDLIHRNSDRIGNLVTQMLQSTKFEELELKDHSVNDLINEVLEEAKDRAQLKGIEIRKNLSSEICNVKIDSPKMKIAILNILINAIEAIEHDHGILTVITRKENEKCVVTISDNGKGIKKEDLDQLFVPFFTNKQNGTGLGLTNMQNIILNHKGSISVQSELEKGTAFTISLNLS